MTTETEQADGAAIGTGESEAAGRPPGEPATPANEALDARVESIVLSNARPVAAGKIAEAIGALAGGLVPVEDIEASIDRLNGVYAGTGRSFRIERVAGGYRVMTQPEYADVLATFHRRQASGRLSRAAIESLAIIAYQQPITRARLEAIRGVGCGEVLRSLLERRLVSVTGRAEEPGRPMLYGTTRHFLDSFGIGSIRELPALGKSPNVDLTETAPEPAPEPASEIDTEPDAGEAPPEHAEADSAKDG